MGYCVKEEKSIYKIIHNIDGCFDEEWVKSIICESDFHANKQDINLDKIILNQLNEEIKTYIYEILFINDVDDFDLKTIDKNKLFNYLTIWLVINDWTNLSEKELMELLDRIIEKGYLTNERI